MIGSTNSPPPLFSVNQVVIATFLAGPLGGASLIAINRRRLGQGFLYDRALTEGSRKASWWSVIGIKLRLQ